MSKGQYTAERKAAQQQRQAREAMLRQVERSVDATVASVEQELAAKYGGTYRAA